MNDMIYQFSQACANRIALGLMDFDHILACSCQVGILQNSAGDFLENTDLS